ncbi:hypothetical protein PSPO01_06677 [Paraphaeosphaeria sporulosa]
MPRTRLPPPSAHALPSPASSTAPPTPPTTSSKLPSSLSCSRAHLHADRCISRARAHTCRARNHAASRCATNVPFCAAVERRGGEELGGVEGCDVAALAAGVGSGDAGWVGVGGLGLGGARSGGEWKDRDT